MSASFLFSLRLSRLLKFSLLLAHGLPWLCVWAPGVPRGVAGLTLVASLVSAGFQLRRARRLADSSLSLQVGGECWLTQGGRRSAVDILPESRDLGWLIVLVWREQNSGRAGRAALTRDGLPREIWRELRRYLRWSVAPELRQLP